MIVEPQTVDIKFTGKPRRFVFVLMDTHLQEPLSRSKELDVKAIADGFFEFFFDGVIAASVEHVVNKEEKA